MAWYLNLSRDTRDLTPVMSFSPVLDSVVSTLRSNAINLSMDDDRTERQRSISNQKQEAYAASDVVREGWRAAREVREAAGDERV